MDDPDVTVGYPPPAVMTVRSLREIEWMRAARLAKSARYAVIHTFNGVTEVRYRRDRKDTRLAREVLGLQRRARAAGQHSPYTISTLPEHTL